MGMIQLSVCAETVFKHLPFEERVRKITDAGFMVEFWRWTDHQIEALAALQDVRISTFVGYVAGSMVHPDGVETFVEGVKKSLIIGENLRCRRLMLSTGELGPQGEVVHAVADHPATMWITAFKTLSRLAEIAEKNDVI